MPKLHRLTIDIESELYKRLAAVANREERSVSKQGKIFIVKALEELEATNKHATKLVKTLASKSASSH